MRDIHCHILPGVDDGAHDLAESLAMLQAAKEAGVTSIVCTPHARDPHFDYEAMWNAYELLVSHAEGFPLQMGFEVNYTLLQKLGEDWIDRLAFDAQTAPPGWLDTLYDEGFGPSGEFLLELPEYIDSYDLRDIDRTIYEIQSRGYQVIIAHPERYLPVQENPLMVEDWVRQGCKLQASADFLEDGRTGAALEPAQAIFRERLYSYIASDAHRVRHYALLAEACRSYRTRGAHAR